MCECDEIKWPYCVHVCVYVRKTQLSREQLDQKYIAGEDSSSLLTNSSC